jgi:hypothetical protein
MELTRTLTLLFLLTLSASAQTPRIPPPESVNRNGLVGRWAWVGGASATVAWNWTRANNGTITGGLPITSGLRPAFSFTGSQYITMPNVEAFSFSDIAGDKPLTFTAWVRPAITNATLIILSRYDQYPNNAQYAFGFSSGRLFGYVAALGLDYHVGRLASARVNPSVWYHVGFTYTGSETSTGCTLFLDGKPYDVPAFESLPYPGMSTSTTPLRIGVRTDGSSPFNAFNGDMADCRIYNRALTAAEIANIYRGVQ